MESEVLKYGWLIVLTLGQIIHIWMKMSEKRNNKKKEGKPENPSYGERIATLEEAVQNIKDDIERIQEKLNRK